MIWSIIRLRTARRMFYLSRWLLQTGEAIVDEEMAKSDRSGAPSQSEAHLVSPSTLLQNVDAESWSRNGPRDRAIYACSGRRNSSSLEKA